MIYLTKFNTQAEYEAYAANNGYVTPNISGVTDPKHIYSQKYIPHDYSQNYLTIVSLEDNNTIGWKTSNSNLLKTISISTDNGTTWIAKESSTAGTTLATLSSGDKLLIKSSNTTYGNSSYYNYFTSTGNFNVEGNIMSMIYGDNFIGQTTLDSAGYNLKQLFYNCAKLISAENLILPATTLANNCYQSMFYGCTSLTTAPELQATTLANYCYHYMFQGCTSLTTAPELPATTLAGGCYTGMFQGCTSLTTAPELPATTLATYCYKEMFSGCTSLTTAPEALPATTLTYNCYEQMFAGCTSLTTAPELPATTLADSCYYYMFGGCTALITAPELPATTLVSTCYEYMFRDCTSLNYIKCLATDISANRCTEDWVGNVAASGTFVKDASMSSWITSVNGIPSGWTVIPNCTDYVYYDLTILSTTKLAQIITLDKFLLYNTYNYQLSNSNNWFTVTQSSITTSNNVKTITLEVDITQNSTGSDRTGTFDILIYDSNNALYDTVTITIEQVYTEYAVVNYIDGGFDQYIDTGIIPTATTGIEIKFNRGSSSYNDDAYVCGCRDNTSNTRWTIGRNGSGYYYGYGGYASITSDKSGSDILIGKLNYLNDKQASISRNDGSFSTVSLPTMQWTPVNNIRLFGAAGISGTYMQWSGRIYYVKITEGSNIIMNLIPILDNNNTPCFYDTISSQYLYNNGTGSFTYG